MGRAPCCSKIGLRRGPWTAKEDNLLIKYIQVHGEGNWRSLPKKAGLLRCGKSCRLRWMNYLRPDIKRGNITSEEEDLIIRLHSLLGNRWSLIAGRLPGRTDNEIKNHWNSHLSKRINPRSSNHCPTGRRKNVNNNHKPAIIKKRTATTEIKVHQPKPTRVVTPIIFSISRDRSSDHGGIISSSINGGSHGLTMDKEPLRINNVAGIIGNNQDFEDYFDILDLDLSSATCHVTLQNCNDYGIRDKNGTAVLEKIIEEYQELLRAEENPNNFSEYAFVDSLLI